VRSVSAARRLSAIVALVAVVAVLAVIVVGLIERPLLLPVAIACVGVAIAAAADAVTRTGARRLVAAVVTVLALVAPLVLLVAAGRLLRLPLLIALLAIAGVATRYGLGRDLRSLKRGPTPGVAVGPATRPVLLLNPKSGGGKVERFGLVAEARRRGIEPVVLAPGDDLRQLAERAVARGADAIGMAGGDGSQALVAGVAAAHDVGFVCVPAGTRNHLAMDLGLDRADVVGALDAFGAAVERRIDLGLVGDRVGDRVFVNNVTMGLYAKLVQSPAYRERKLGTALELLPGMLGPDAVPFDLRFVGPDGTDHTSAHLVLVANNKYELGRAEGFGSRRRLDAGTLGIVAARFERPSELAQLVQPRPAGGRGRPRGWLEWTGTGFLVRSGGPVEIGVDGEAVLLDPPIRFGIVPGALRVRIPPRAPGYSPAAAVPTSGWSTVTALLQSAAGRPVTIQL
jgi:diacylglycerol kinase family enzyme